MSNPDITEALRERLKNLALDIPPGVSRRDWAEALARTTPKILRTCIEDSGILKPSSKTIGYTISHHAPSVSLVQSWFDEYRKYWRCIRKGDYSSETLPPSLLRTFNLNLVDHPFVKMDPNHMTFLSDNSISGCKGGREKPRTISIDTHILKVDKRFKLGSFKKDDMEEDKGYNPERTKTQLVIITYSDKGSFPTKMVSGTSVIRMDNPSRNPVKRIIENSHFTGGINDRR